ncbi:porin family protein [Sulfurovum sp.]|uniref:porin family protein n=1 Tax=Sulfurovum sp. TaxID=1969726 RepID=UPI003567CD9C
MNKVVLSVCTVMAMSSLGFAGGDMKDVEPAVVPVVEVIEEEKNFYVGLGLSALSTREGSLDFFDDKDDQDRTGNLAFLAGYEFNPYVAVEGRYSTYIAEEDWLNSDTWGIYLKPQYPVNEDFNVYALLGFGGMSVDGVDGFDMDVDDTGFQWGLGVSYGVAEDFAIFVDYVSIASDMDADAWFGRPTDVEVDADAITVGVTYSF